MKHMRSMKAQTPGNGRFLNAEDAEKQRFAEFFWA